MKPAQLSFHAFVVLLAVFTGFQCQSSRMEHEYTNHLIHESSPYLLQHAYNPVNWYPWGEEALKKAKDENKLLLISIGYSSCHWCHVMEHESFSDSAVAELMNKYFVNIKVDREERPDVDDVYMTACQLSSGGACGWPLNAFALPDGRPVWAGTYFPKSRWMEVLEYFNKTYIEQPQNLQAYAEQLVVGIQDHGLSEIISGPQEWTDEKADEISRVFLQRMDPTMGGRRGAPKFPMPNNWQYLMHYAYRYDAEAAKKQVLVTLDKMMNGGIYDHLEGGFARYSTDSLWLVPHFEKMLYDNGQLVTLYAQAYGWTGDKKYLDVVRHTLDFVDQYWSDVSGGFYSSFDADSEGEEGKYYVWNIDELNSIIEDPSGRKIYFDYYDIVPAGNWEHGKNILNVHRDLSTVAQHNGISEEEVSQRIKTINEKLISVRQQRIAPGLDDKIITSWNGLMLQGFVEAYKVSCEKKYLDRAVQNGEFILNNLVKDGHRLDRNYKNGKSSINGFLDDYANVIQAFLALYQSTFDYKWLDHANQLTQHVLNHFDGDPSAMFYYTSDEDPPLVARRIEVSDNVIPSGNSTMAKNLLVLGELLYNETYTQRAESMMHKVWPLILKDGHPSFYSNWCQVMLMLIKPPFEVAILGDEYEARLKEIQKTYRPDALYLGGKDEGKLPLLENKLSPGQTLIYICQNKVCKFPTGDVNKAVSLME